MLIFRGGGALRSAPHVHVMGEQLCTCLLASHLVSASVLGPVFGNRDHFVGLTLFLDTFRNDLHGMDVSGGGAAGAH